MKYRETGNCAVQLALLLGGWVAPVAVTANQANAVSLQAFALNQPALMQAKVWQVDQDPRAYLISEKLDGVRAFWDGQTLKFRSGLAIAAPGWFLAALPKTPLDGELWLGRGRFDELSAMVRRNVPVDAQWRALHYMIFDLPGASGPFTERAYRITELVAQAQQPWLQAVSQQHVSDTLALQKLLKNIVLNGGEGLVLHRDNALWAPGRSDALLKFKPLLDDEARVVAHLPGKGRHAGRLGALMLELPDGQRFALGTGFTDAQRAAPPPLNSVVTYRYRNLTPKGLPRFASYLRVRGLE